MALILAWLAALGPVVLPLVRRVLFGLGIGAVAFSGIDALWSSVQSEIWSNLGSTSASVLAVLGMARVDDAIKVVLSAGSAVMVWKGLNAAGVITRWR